MGDVRSLLETKYIISVISSNPKLETVRSLGDNVSITSIEIEKVPDRLKRVVEYYKVYTDLGTGRKITYKVPWAVFLKLWNRYTVTVLHSPEAKEEVLEFLTKWRLSRNKIRNILSVSGMLYSC